MHAAPAGCGVDVGMVIAGRHDSAAFCHTMGRALTVSADGHRGGADLTVRSADIRARRAGADCAHEEKRSRQIADLFHVVGPFTVQ